MPFNPQQINPVDLNPNVAVGVNLPLNGPAVFISNFTTKDAIKNNLINFSRCDKCVGIYRSLLCSGKEVWMWFLRV